VAGTLGISDDGLSDLRKIRKVHEDVGSAKTG
jgi:hypothetical protein